MPPATPRTAPRRKAATAKPAAKKPTAPSPDPVPPVPGEELPEVVELTTTKTSDDEMVPIFTLDGTTYEIESNAKARTVINGMWAAQDGDPRMMMLKFIARTLGEDAFNALLGYKDLDFDVLTQVMDRITSVTIGKTSGGDAQGNA